MKVNNNMTIGFLLIGILGIIVSIIVSSYGYINESAVIAGLTALVCSAGIYFAFNSWDENYNENDENIIEQVDNIEEKLF